jgi:hypothetical protein
MSRPLFSGILAILALAGWLHSSFSPNMVLAEEPSARPQERQEVLSPLHALLGIDPVTGQFKSPSPAQPPVASQPPSETETLAANSEEKAPEKALQQDPSPAADSPSSTIPDRVADQRPTATERPPVDAVADRAEVVLGAVSDFLEGADQESLSKVASVLPQAFQEDALLNRYLAFYWWMSLAVIALLALYPIGILISELSGWWTRRHDRDLSVLDQTYHRTRLRRRLLLAGLLLGLAILVPLGGYSFQWANSPAWLTAYWGVVLLLAVWAWVLGAVVKRSAKWYAQAVVRELRRNQLELQQELDDLRKRIANLRLTAGV